MRFYLQSIDLVMLFEFLILNKVQKYNIISIMSRFFLKNLDLNSPDSTLFIIFASQI